MCCATLDSYAISTAAKNILMKEGQYAMVLEDQMASNVLPWQDLCRRCGGHLCVIRRPPDHDWTAAILSRMRTLKV
jgi:selenocysteine lyase/cysteine desulfurase